MTLDISGKVLVEDMSTVCEVDMLALSLLTVTIEVTTLPSFEEVVMGIEPCNPLIDDEVELITVTIESTI